MRSLSLVIPVFNAPDLARAAWAAVPRLALVAADCGFKLVEVLFVDDGSTPPLEFPQPADASIPLRLLRNDVNRGKGFSVRRGALAANGDWVLMSDVDMSAPFDEFAKLAAHADAWMVCGSRYGRPGMPLVRRLLSRLFHLCTRLAGATKVMDTQCGFKLFRMEPMRAVFAAQRIERFAFDVELVLRVERAGGSLAEVPVTWRGGQRSSLRVLHDAPRMLRDLLSLRMAEKKRTDRSWKA